MLAAARQLLADFLSTILFLLVYGLFGQIGLAIVVGIVAALIRLIVLKIKGRRPDAMEWLSIGLVLVLGGISLLTHEPRFVLVKPALIHIAIGGVMLRRGWLSRYMPPIGRQYVPELAIVAAGYAWAGFMVALGIAIFVIALVFDFAVWAWFVSIGVMTLQIAAFLLTFAVLRVIGGREARRLHASSSG